MRQYMIWETHHQLLSFQLPKDLCVKVRSKVLKIKKLSSLLLSYDKLWFLYEMTMHGLLPTTPPSKHWAWVWDYLDKLVSTPTNRWVWTSTWQWQVSDQRIAQASNPGLSFWLALFTFSPRLRDKIWGLGMRLIPVNCQLQLFSILPHMLLFFSTEVRYSKIADLSSKMSWSFANQSVTIMAVSSLLLTQFSSVDWTEMFSNMIPTAMGWAGSASLSS